MADVDSVTIFEVADDRRAFLDYLASLYEAGIRPEPRAWLEDAATRLVGQVSPDLAPPTYLDQAWTLERRRLLVVLTWPQRGGGRTLKFPFRADSDDREWDLAGVFGRSYAQLWADVRDNLKWLVALAQRHGSWDVLAREWDLWGHVLWETARLGLVQTHDGRTITQDVVDGLMADEWDRPSKARSGFVLAWWDLVAVAECAGYCYEPLVGQALDDGDELQDGRFTWNRSNLLNRVGAAVLARRSHDEILRRALAEAQALRSPELDPAALHCRITAGGRIEPPAVGSKYRALFEHLDAMDFAGVHGTVTLAGDDLRELLSPSDTRAPRGLRGARKPGLPAAAHTEQWWYGPWNPNAPVSDRGWDGDREEAWATALAKKSHTRAWMAAGVRAKPVIDKRVLREVVFEPVLDRRYWWPWRESLRDGSYARLISAGLTAQ